DFSGSGWCVAHTGGTNVFRCGECISPVYRQSAGFEQYSGSIDPSGPERIKTETHSRGSCQDLACQHLGSGGEDSGNPEQPGAPESGSQTMECHGSRGSQQGLG